MAGLAGLNRKAMEEERLARASKRVKVEGSKPAATEQTSLARMVPEKSTAVPKVKCNIDSDLRTSAYVKKPSPTPDQQPVKGPQYPRATIKRTWASSFPRQNDLTIEDVLQPEQLRKAALSSFQWDNDWLWSKIDLTRTNVMIIMQGKTEHDQVNILEDANAFNPRIKVCFPPMPGTVNCMHSKLMLLFYDTHMRIAIPTANLTEFDWGDDGRMENSVFLIDLPQRSGDSKQESQGLTAFGKELYFFLEQMSVPKHLLEALLRYDFHETRNLAFVHSVGNDHQTLDSAHSTGYPGLGQAIQQLDLQTETLELDVAVSSIGALKPDFLNAFYDAARGATQNTVPTLSHKTRKRQYEQRMRIYFPSQDTVVNSLGGPEAGGTICFQRKWYNDPTFPRHLFREYKSTRAGLLSHNKIVFGRGVRIDDTSPEGKKSVAWAYVGSHNLSESAWGRVTIDKSKEPKINCRNWECGVLVPLETEMRVDQDKFPTLGALKERLDVPFELPGASYDGKEPWFFDS